MSPQDQAKIQAGEQVIKTFVKAGMKVGLGSGTTSHFFVRALGRYVRQGLKITATTTSQSTTRVAQDVGIKITDIDDMGDIDLTIDGPDEIDSSFRMIKGGGACLLWEKIIAHASQKMVTICDETKLVKTLGAFPLPIEVVPFGWHHSQRLIGATLSRHGIHAEITRREKASNPIMTDSGHFILDCQCREIAQPEALELSLNQIPGVVENGLFTREADAMCVGCFDGTAYVKIRPHRSQGDGLIV